MFRPHFDAVSVYVKQRKLPVSKVFFMAFKKLDKRHTGVLLPLFVSIIMSCLVSGISTFRSAGFSDAFLDIWMGNWAVSWMVAFPILLFVLPMAKRLTALIVE